MNVELPLRLAVASCYSQEANQRWTELILTESPDWEHLSHQALFLGLAPLLYDAFRRNGLETVSSTVENTLRQAYYDTASLNLLAMNDLAIAVRALAAFGVPTIVLKGAALVQVLYENLALRPMVDVDLLVPFDSLPPALEALAALGYIVQQPFPFKDESGWCWNEIMLLKPGTGGTVLELHWHLLDNPYYAQKIPTGAYLFPRSLPLNIESETAQMLAPEDQLLHLCIHNLFHHLGQLYRTGADIAFLLTKFGDQIDWDHLLNLAIDSQMILALESTLSQAANQWYAPVPKNVLAELSTLQPRVRERFFLRSQRSEFLKVLRTFAMLPGLDLRGQFVFGQLFPERAYMEWRYGTRSTTPLPLAYTRRYASGMTAMLGELKAWAKSD
jgi:hypothetical protein